MIRLGAYLLLALLASAGWALAEDVRTVPTDRLQMQLSFAPLVKQTASAVVNVYADKQVQRPSLYSGDPFFDEFFGQQMPNRTE
eukprot:gene55447-75976_t